jgi:Holliday junction DNA helicase RuvA
MFYYLKGTVAHIAPYLAVIDCGGVGYACKTTNYTLASLHKGETTRLFTYLSVSESGADLFGFGTEEEKNLFLLLTSVSGVGPKAALSILSTAAPSQLALSIITGDAKTLTAAPGVGKKIAQRIVLELKDKLAKEQENLLQSVGNTPSGASTIIPEDKLSEAGAALQVLGYSIAEINTALKEIDLSSLTLEEIIKQALKRLSRS